MLLHLYTTDVSALDLLHHLPEGVEISALVVPRNRSGTAKLKMVLEANTLPVVWHDRTEGLMGTPNPPADAAISWMYSQILRGDLLRSYRMGGLNMHGGSLPEYRGANVLNWAIANGEKALGVTWHAMVEAVDAGGIYAETQIPIGPADDAETMRAAILREGARLFPEAWARFSTGSPPVRLPDLARGTVWPPRRPEHGCIEAGLVFERLRALVRAQAGRFPRARILHDGDWHEVEAVRALAAEEHPGAGEILYCCADGAVAALALGRKLVAEGAGKSS